MTLFYSYNKIYNLKDCKMRIQNVQILELKKDNYEIVTKPKNLKYFKEPKKTAYPLNLNEGFNDYIFRKINVLYGNTLSKVMQYDIKKNISSNFNKSKSFNIFTHRLAIINIMQSHFYKTSSHFFDWNLCVTKFGNNIYMFCENDDYRYPNCKQGSYHYKLEQILFADSPFTEPKTNVPVDENIRLNGVYQCQLGNFNLIYSAEVQGIISDTEIKDFTNMDSLNKCHFVNTKVKLGRGKTAQKQLQKYFQNYLANVDVTYWAVRNDEGLIKNPIQPEKTMDMFKNQPWHPIEYEQFLYDFLSLIVEKMAHVNSLVTTYEFNYRSTDKAVSYKIHEGRTAKSFLAEDYIKFMEKKQ